MNNQCKSTSFPHIFSTPFPVLFFSLSGTLHVVYLLCLLCTPPLGGELHESRNDYPVSHWLLYSQHAAKKLARSRCSKNVLNKWWMNNALWGVSTYMGYLWWLLHGGAAQGDSRNPAIRTLENTDGDDWLTIWEKKNKVKSSPTSSYKIYSRWIKEFSVKNEGTKS